MVITILTLFPEIFPPVLSSSILGRAQKKGLVTFKTLNIRDFASDKHKSVDDKPYGGGTGMLIRIDILDKAIQAARIKKKNIKEKVILMDPRGKAYTHEYARKLSSLDHLIIICGHYEGIDERIYNFIDGAVSIGKYVLTGGEIPAMVICDSVCRLIKGVLAKDDATINESFSQINNLEAPQYTKPQKYKGYEVPEILLSGNHQAISDWKRKNTKLFE